MTGRFITIEGPDGAGKSTLANGLAEHLAIGGEVILTREPGDGPAGPAIREVLLNSGHLDPWTEVFLFLADRHQHCQKVIRPALIRGATVICDRFADSTVVYQGHARGLDIALLKRLNHLATGGLVPDATFLLDLPAEAASARLQNHDRLDAEPPVFHRKVRDGFLVEAKLERRWHTLDATAPPEEILAKAIAELAHR